MDTLPTKPEINREKEEDRKSGVAGLFGRLLGGGSGSGGLAGAGASGGLLATKAGIIGLVLIGTTVAGGVGVVGYKVFGPGADESMGEAQSLFEARPASERVAAGGEAGATGGVSNSLQFLADANNQPAESVEGASADAAASEGAASEAPASQTVAASGSSSHMGVDGKANATVAAAAAAKLAGGKFGALNKNVGGGGSGASATAQAASGTGLLASSKGNSAPFSANAARTASTAGGGQRSLAIRRSGGLAGKQLFAVSKDMKSNRGSSQAYGTTYDGSAGPSGSGIGGDNNIAAGGTGQGAGVSDSPESAYGRGPDDKLPDAPPNIDGENATPWQDALNKSLMYIAGAMLLCFLAGKLADNQTYGKIAAAVLGAIAAGLAIKAMSLGMEIGGGKYAQSLQGGLITVAATFALLQAGLCVAGSNEKVAAAMGDVSMLMKYAGAGAMVAMAVAYMKPLKSYPASEFENGKPPDARGSIIRPADIGTEEPAQRYLALAHRSGRAEA